MTITSERLAGALRGVLPIAVAVAEDPHHIDRVDARKLTHAAHEALAMHNQEQAQADAAAAANMPTAVMTPSETVRARTAMLDKLIREAKFDGTVMKGLYFLRIAIASGRLVEEEEMVELNSIVGACLLKDLTHAKLAGRLYKDLLNDYWTKSPPLSAADAEAQARERGWMTFGAPSIPDRLSVTHPTHRCLFNGPDAWHRALSWHRRTIGPAPMR